MATSHKNKITTEKRTNDLKTVCETDKCTGCMACKDVCPYSAISIKDSLVSYNAVIDEKLCINCGACERVCQVNDPPKMKEPVMWKQGWAANPDIRKKSSSGGAAAVLEREFIRNGGYVCSCVFLNGRFVYQLENKLEGVEKFAGSKYVKSDPSGIYKQVKDKLTQGEKVLFLGLPCHVAAVKKFIGKKLQEHLYTVDLICHGTPSPEILTKFLQQHNTDIATVSDISFRTNNSFYIQCDKKPVTMKNCLDKYSMGFLNSLFYTESCYECKYANTNRVSDITLGDSWGSNLSADEQSEGISLIVCQTEKGKELLENIGLELCDVDSSCAIANNHQLRTPSSMPSKREYFFAKMKSGTKLDTIIRKCYPKSSFKQFIKSILLKLKIKK